MSTAESRDRIDRFLSEVRKKLPDTFEAEDILEDLRTHIDEALRERVAAHPDTPERELLEKVLDEIGDPDTIAKEYEAARLDEEGEESGRHRMQMALRCIVAVVVSVPAAWVFVDLTHGMLDFPTALTVLLIFALLEGIVRSWQTESS